MDSSLVKTLDTMRGRESSLLNGFCLIDEREGGQRLQCVVGCLFTESVHFVSRELKSPSAGREALRIRHLQNLNVFGRGCRFPFQLPKSHGLVICKIHTHFYYYPFRTHLQRNSPILHIFLFLFFPFQCLLLKKLM